mgnify:CR=1 FL=1
MQANKLIASTLGLAAAGLVAAPAQAATVNVTGNITTSTTWTSDNEYQLDTVVYVEPGATLTIQPGTIVRGNGANTALAVARGAQIFAEGTKDAPIIMTSVDDTGSAPDGTRATYSGTSAEWGNLTLLGNAIIGEDGGTTNADNAPDGTAEDQMEGLEDLPGGFPFYGGPDDNDDSGVLSYVSLRYGGRVVGTANELNGISIGGVGRGTDIRNIEIFSNVDDGIEIWGGTVNIKYATIWYIGDDSFDLDEGWRGKAQFVLIVQGANDPSPAGLTADVGTGVGDSLFEMDGVEGGLEVQPFGTPLLYNFTAIGMPPGSLPGFNEIFDFSDNQRLQIANSVFIQPGGGVTDGSPSAYPAGSSFNDLLARDYDVFSANELAVLNEVGVTTGTDFYTTYTSGKWIQFTDSVWYEIDTQNDEGDIGSAELAALGQTAAGYNNVVNPTSLPIQKLVRDPEFIVDGRSVKLIAPAGLDPRAANDAVTSVGTAPDDGFFTPAQYRGAFSEDVNWALGWTAADQYGLYDTTTANPAQPAATLEVLATVVSFQTQVGLDYVVEESTDGGVVWNPVPGGSISGDGSIVDVQTLLGTSFDGNALYRVIVQ